MPPWSSWVSLEVALVTNGVVSLPGHSKMVTELKVHVFFCLLRELHGSVSPPKYLLLKRFKVRNDCSPGLE